MSAGRPFTSEVRPLLLRIGEVAKLTDLTTRTLRYWEELGLVVPSSYGSNGERLYSATDMNSVTRIRDLQRLLGFSLAEVRVVLETEEVHVLDRIKSEFRSSSPSRGRQSELLDEAITANDQLMARLDDTLSRIQAFRAERLQSATRLRARRKELGSTVEDLSGTTKERGARSRRGPSRAQS